MDEDRARKLAAAECLGLDLAEFADAAAKATASMQRFSPAWECVRLDMAVDDALFDDRDVRG